MRLLVTIALLTAACRHDDQAAVKPTPSAPPAVTEAPRPDASAQDVFARTLCDWYWRSSSSSARPYDSMDECIASETKPRACDERQAHACAAFARDAKPGMGRGLHDSPDCAACLAPAADPALAAAIAEQNAALDRAKFTIHSAKVHTGKWPAELASKRDAAHLLLNLDVELSGYGYRIDPDDFLLERGDEVRPTIVGSNPYTERLTRSGKPIGWTDPSVIDDPDLRMRAYFVVETAERTQSLRVTYNGKRSQPFRLR